MMDTVDDLREQVEREALTTIRDYLVSQVIGRFPKIPNNTAVIVPSRVDVALRFLALKNQK